MKIHFICRGNTFRSRLAEAYVNSLHIAEYEASSSGVEASQNLNGTICWYTKKILERDGRYFHDKGHWTQTSQKEVNANDLLIFMDKSCFETFTIDLSLDITGKKYIVWDIQDIDAYVAADEMHNEAHVTQASEYIYNDIRGAVEKFAESGVSQYR